MSFASPLWLFSLLVVPLALAAYLFARRRAKRYAIRFPAVATVREVIATERSWTRHIPAALMLAALAALGVALARPNRSYRAPIQRASMMLVTDHSGSMAADDVQPTRLAAAEKAANAFIDQLPKAARLGAIAFSSSPDAVQAPVTNHAAARAIIDSQAANGATATGDALQLALGLLHGSNPKHTAGAIVLLSDGAANAGVDAATVAQQAGKDKVPIFTVALGTASGVLPNPDPIAPPVSVPPDPELMQQIAKLSGGHAFDAQSSDELSSIYKRLGTQLGSVTKYTDVTAAAAMAGVLLLIAAAGASVRFSGRLP
jgi:Ca-activated chloride channel family protein